MKKFKFYQFFSIVCLFFLIVSCNETNDLFVLDGEDPKDLQVFELDNEYLAEEAHDYIDFNYPSIGLDKSYILIGKKSFGFEAVLLNTESLSFDEGGQYKYNRKEKSSKENLKNGKNGKCDSKCKSPRDKVEWIKLSDLPNGVVDYLHKEYLDSMFNGNYVLDSVAKAGKIIGLKDKDADSKSTYYVVHVKDLKGILYFNDKGEFLKIHKPKFKRHCKKLRHLDLLKSIKLYVEENHPDHYIVHARKVRTKGGNVFFLVKLVSSDKQNFVVLKFDKDGVLVTS